MEVSVEALVFIVIGRSCSEGYGFDSNYLLVGCEKFSFELNLKVANNSSLYLPVCICFYSCVCVEGEVRRRC